jgi:hypothetical protein
VNGTSGSSGTSGIGENGTSGTSGTSGIGENGTSGTSGSSGASPTGQIILTAAGGWPSITNGAGLPLQAQTTTNLVNYYYVPFVDGSQTFLNWGIAMPSDYNGGTVTAIFYWEGTATGSVVWGIAGRAFADGDVLDQAFGTPQTVTDATSGIQEISISSATSAITLAGTPAAGQYVQFRVYRDGGAGGDTMTGAADLIQVRITYTRE